MQQLGTSGEQIQQNMPVAGKAYLVLSALLQALHLKALSAQQPAEVISATVWQALQMPV